MKKVLFLLHIPPPLHGSSVMGDIINKSNLIAECCIKDIFNLSTSDSLVDTGKFSHAKFAKLLSLYLRLSKIIIERKYALVYFAPTLVGIGFYKDLVTMVILKLCGQKVILHLHNKGVKSNQGPILTRIYKFFFRDTKIVILNEKLVSDIESVIRRDQVIVCANGVGHVPDKLEMSKKFSGEVLNIIFVSNLIISKGILDVLKACRHLMEHGREFRLNIIGAEADLKEDDLCEIIEKFGLKNYVFYLGPRIGKDKETWLKKSDVLVFPSYYRLETFGLVVLEALQHGLAVICTAIDGLDGIIKDGYNGFVVQPKSPLEIYSRLVYLIDNIDEAKIIGTNGFLTYCESYTQVQFEARLAGIIKSQLELV